MQITRCTCRGKFFSELKEMAEKNNVTTPKELAKLIGNRSGCGMCESYIDEMLKTGQTSFELELEPVE